MYTRSGMQIVGRLDVTKAAVDQRRVWGWANLSRRRDGRTVVDLQGDIIHEDDLAEAAYRFVKDYRHGGVDHNKQPPVATLIESFMVTSEKVAALGIPEGTLPIGWFAGFEFADSPAGREAFESVKDGTRSWFSIEAIADARTVEEVV